MQDKTGNVDPATDTKNWKSVLIKSKRGSFLEPDRLLQKVKLQMSRYGI